MKTKASQVRTYRDVFSLVADLGYSAESVSGLRRQAADIDFTAMLETRRQAAGLTQAEVAKRMGVAQSTVSRLESDRWQDLRLGELVAYLQACKGMK
jgi:predicted XRE-type DNA-binding protein